MREQLLEDGWAEPLERTPVPTPDHWRGGDVGNTGGGIMCRVWRHAYDPYEVVYNLDDETVQLLHTEDSDGNYAIDVIETVNAPAVDDMSKAYCAASLMFAVEAGIAREGSTY